MTEASAVNTPNNYSKAQEQAYRHLWMHFATAAPSAQELPMIVRGEGSYIYDEKGRKILDGLAGLFTVQIGHGRTELAEAAAAQAKELAYFPVWSYGNPKAAELAARLAELAPGDLNRVFFSNSGSESVETAWKLAKQYFKLTGNPLKHKVLARKTAYHGTTHGALSVTGIPDLKSVFEPLVPSSHRVPNTNFYRAAEMGYGGDPTDEAAFGVWAADAIEEAILSEGPETVAAIFLEPVQNAGGCFTPPPGYFQRVREICDRHNVLFVSDETICAFGRVGEYFGADRFGYQPDIITTAKGLTSGYSPMGVAIISDKLYEPFASGQEMFLHGYTFGGHPVSSAVALANLDIFESEQLNQKVKEREGAFLNTLRKLEDLNIVGNVRGVGYFYGIELVQDKATKQTLTEDQAVRVLKGFVSHDLWDNGLFCRADDRQDPVIQLSPPLIAEQAEFDVIEQTLRQTLVKAQEML